MLNPTVNAAVSFSCLPAPSGARPWGQEAVPRAALESMERPRAAANAVPRLPWALLLLLLLQGPSSGCVGRMRRLGERNGGGCSKSPLPASFLACPFPRSVLPCRLGGRTSQQGERGRAGAGRSRKAAEAL